MSECDGCLHSKDGKCKVAPPCVATRALWDLPCPRRLTTDSAPQTLEDAFLQLDTHLDALAASIRATGDGVAAAVQRFKKGAQR